MTQKLFILFTLLTSIKVLSQIDCKDFKYTVDSLATIDNNLFTGQCVTQTEKLTIKRYLSKGLLDSIIFLDKKGHILTFESYYNEFSTYKSFYKNGAIKQCINFKNDKYFGLWLEYYKNGKPKYEAEYIEDNTIKNDTHFTWNKRGEKYIHYCTEKGVRKNIGKLTFDAGYGKCKKTKVKNAT